MTRPADSAWRVVGASVQGVTHARAGQPCQDAHVWIETAGGAATIPDSLPVRVNETIISAEVYYDFEPLFDLLIEPEVIYRSAFIRPRLGTLTTLEP